jgi:hypothetical protein
MNVVEEKLHHVLGGCPKRKVCNLYQVKAKTCIWGPYQYCGKYRSIIEKKKPKAILNVAK